MYRSLYADKKINVSDKKMNVSGNVQVLVC
jgi:hypothetical protein